MIKPEYKQMLYYACVPQHTQTYFFVFWLSETQ